MTAIFTRGASAFLDGGVDLDADTIRAALLDLNTTETGVHTITDVTNATPMVVSATSHGLTSNDLVLIFGVLGNLAANGIWRVTVINANSFSLQVPDPGSLVAGANAVGSGTYTSGGYVVCLGPSASGDDWGDFDGCIVGSLVSLSSKVITEGLFECGNVTFASVSGATVRAVVLFRDTGTPSTSRMLAIYVGYHLVTVSADAVVGDAVIWVEPLQGGVAASAVLTFSNGKSASLLTAADGHARQISVSPLTDNIPAGSRALVAFSQPGFPVTPNGGNIRVVFSGDNKVFRIITGAGAD